jgi:acyl-CoA synthetase (AMP-forming)/AMP-acid ligase II
MPAMGESRGSLVDVLRTHALERPGQRAFAFAEDGERVGDWLTTGELDARARAIATRLGPDAGGERALLLYPAGVDFVAAFFGCLYAGAIPVPVFPPERARPRRTARLAAITEDAKPRFALSVESTLNDPGLSQAAPRPLPPTRYGRPPRTTAGRRPRTRPSSPTCSTRRARPATRRG